MKKNKSDELEEVGVSHNPNIKKRILINSDEFNNIQSFGRAVFNCGDKTTPHIHEDMIEVFYILSGKGVFHTNNEEIEVSENDYVTIPSGEIHWQSNPFKDPLELLYFGIKD